MKHLLVIVMSLFITLNASACNGKENNIIPAPEEENNNSENNGENSLKGDTLIVYFSRTGKIMLLEPSA